MTLTIALSSLSFALMCSGAAITLAAFFFPLIDELIDGDKTENGPL